MTHQVAAEGQSDLAAQITAALVGMAGQKTPAAPQPQPAAATDAAKPDASAEATARIFAILDCDDAKERPKFARALAGNAKLSVDEAKALLAAAAPEKAEAKADDKTQLASGLSAEMVKRGNSAAIAPAGGADGSQRPSVADRVAAKYPQKKGA